MFRVYGAVLAAYAVGYWFFGDDLGIGLDLFGASIGIWVVSEILHRFWSTPMRWLSGLVGFGVAIVFGITPGEMIAAPGDYWWMASMWLPALVARQPAEGRRTHSPWFWAGLASFMVAYAIWQTGNADHDWCSPDSVIQAHAIWHLLTAFATWCFFQFFRTERPVRELVDASPPLVSDGPSG